MQPTAQATTNDPDGQTTSLPGWYLAIWSRDGRDAADAQVTKDQLTIARMTARGRRASN